MVSDLEVVQRTVRAVFPESQVRYDDGGDCESYIVTGTQMSLYREKFEGDSEGPKEWTVQKTVYYSGSHDEPPGYDAVDVRTALGIAKAALDLVEMMAHEAAYAEIENIGIEEMIAEDAAMRSDA